MKSIKVWSLDEGMLEKYTLLENNLKEEQ